MNHAIKIFLLSIGVLFACKANNQAMYIAALKNSTSQSISIAVDKQGDRLRGNAELIDKDKIKLLQAIPFISRLTFRDDLNLKNFPAKALKIRINEQVWAFWRNEIGLQYILVDFDENDNTVDRDNLVVKSVSSDTTQLSVHLINGYLYLLKDKL